jgi:hypothetical protein
MILATASWKSRQRLWLLSSAIVLGFMSGSCEIDDQSYELHESSAANELPGLAYIRSMQMLRYSINGEAHDEIIDFSDNGGCDPSNFINNLNCAWGIPAAFRSIMIDECNRKINCTPEDIQTLPQNEQNACSYLSCATEMVTCQVNFLLEVARLESPLSIVLTNEDVVEVPVQSFVTRAGLKESAFRTVYFKGALAVGLIGYTFGSYTFNDIAASPTDCQTYRDDPPTINWMDSLYVALAEIAQLARESARAAAADYVALADGLMGRRALLPLASMEVRVVRAHAAHLLIGGGWNRQPELFEPYLLFEPYEVISCQEKPLSNSERRALTILRQSGISPYMIGGMNDDVLPSLDDLLVGLDGDNVKERYARSRGLELSSLMTADEFLLSVGLARADFAAARATIAEENQIFGRSGLVDPSRTLFDINGVNPLPAYLATLVGPSSVHWSHMAARTLDHSIAAPIPGGSGSPPAPMRLEHLDFPALVGLNARVESLAMRLSLFGDGSAAENTHERRLYDLGVNLRRALTPYGMVFVYGTRDDSTSENDIHFIGVTPDDPTKYGLIMDRDSLDCAVIGSRDGLSCEPSDIVMIGGQEGSIEGDPEEGEIGLGLAASLYGENAGEVLLGDGYVLRFSSQRITSQEPLYFVRTRDATGQKRGVGAWEVVAVAQAYIGNYYEHVYFDTASFEQAGRIMSPSTKWCVEPMITCGEDSFDTRIPLEDELTDDGNPYENSWRRYLTLAREAAEAADALGQEARGASLSMDELAEESLKELHELCGAVVSLDPFAACAGGACSSTLEEIFAAENPYGVDGNMNRLARCLGVDGESVVGLATLGADPLCAWKLRGPSDGPGEGDDSTLCQYVGQGPSPYVGAAAHEAAAPPELQCPRFRMPNDLDCAVPGGNDTEYSSVIIGLNQRELLKFYQKPEDETVEIEEPMSCESIRNLRASFVSGNSVNGKSYDELVSEVFYSDGGPAKRWLPQNIVGIAASIRWEAKPGDFSSLYVGNNVLASTGNYISGNQATVICSEDFPSQAAAYDCGADWATGDALFCRAWDCQINGGTTPGDGLNGRRRLNSRLSRAAQMARLLAGLDFGGANPFVFPVAADGTASNTKPQSFEVAFDDSYVVSQENSYWFASTYANGATWYTSQSRANFVASKIWYGESESTEVWHSPASTTNNETLKNRYSSNWAKYVMGLKGAGIGPWLSDWRAQGGLAHTPLGFLAFPHPNFQSAPEFLADPGADPYRYNVYSEEYDYMPILSAGNSHLLLNPAFAGNLNTHFWGYEFPSSVAGIFDAMEVLCEAGKRGSSSRFGCGALPPIETREQVFHAADQLECVANKIKSLGARIVLHGLPVSTLDALRERSAVGATPGEGGQYAQSVSRIRQRLISLSLLPHELDAQLSGISRDVRRLANELDRADIQDSINKNQLRSAIVDRVNSCVVAAANVSNGSLTGIGGRATAAASTCTASAVQIGLSIRNARLQAGLVEADRDRLLMDLEDGMARRTEALEALGKQLLFEAEGLDAELAQLQSLRERGRRALYRALFMDDSDTQGAFSTSSALRQRFNTAQTRYETARRDAIRMGFIAKRAIEQRFGVKLAVMTEQMTLVDPPSSWESGVCTLSGIRPLGGRDEEDDYADAFLGDWVKKLERFVDSYRIDHPFSDGSDQAVVSIRDDVIKSRAVCDVWTGNLINWSNDLRRDGEINGNLWGPRYCNEKSNGDLEPNCVALSPIDEFDETLDVATAYGAPSAFRLHFGPPHPECDEPQTCPCESSDCGWNADVMYGQRTWLDRGYYQLSWYARPGPGAVLADAESAFVVRKAASMTDLSIYDDGAVEKWNDFYRYWGTVHVTEPAVYFVGIKAPGEADAILDVGGLTLVEITGRALSASEEPVPFTETTGAGMRMLPVCEDTDGTNFRREAWRRNCQYLCGNGLSDSCSPEDSSAHCYWETEFFVSPKAIDRGDIFSSSGFARGNFNYRLDSIALNFVGSAARVCTDPLLPSTCYNAGWIPYSLEHRGPYTVLNNFGDYYDAPLFTGRIEHARGLAVERYITNPISSADQSLISQYTTTQFRGRPLTGWYVLRVWDEPGVNFEGIEDVQVVLNYRYWTRQN